MANKTWILIGHGLMANKNTRKINGGLKLILGSQLLYYYVYTSTRVTGEKTLYVHMFHWGEDVILLHVSLGRRRYTSARLTG